MRLFSYVVARDFGFAPNPFYGYCTLCTCKFIIRRVAQLDDWVLGTGSKVRGREGRAVFAMRITDALTYDDYWADPRFLPKRPRLHGSKKQAFGDNIYHRDHRGGWRQENSHHSLADGSENQRNIANDTQTDRVLVSGDYVYWGGEGPSLPRRLRDHGGVDICAGRNHKSNCFPDPMIAMFIRWVRGRKDTGYAGIPLDWRNRSALHLNPVSSCAIVSRTAH